MRGRGVYLAKYVALGTYVPYPRNLHFHVTTPSIRPSFSRRQFCTSSHCQHNTTTMLLPRLQPPLRVALTLIARNGGSAGLNEAFAQLAIGGSRVGRIGGSVGGVRYAHHKAQGAVNKAKDGPGKRLGAKKSGGERRSVFAGRSKMFWGEGEDGSDLGILGS